MSHRCRCDVTKACHCEGELRSNTKRHCGFALRGRTANSKHFPCPTNVRCTPEIGYFQCTGSCPLRGQKRTSPRITSERSIPVIRPVLTGQLRQNKNIAGVVGKFGKVADHAAT